VDSAGVPGNSDSFRPFLSADGRYVAFRSVANNLVSGDSNAMWDVFVRDRQTGTTERVSVSSAGVQGDNHSGKAVLSADGSAVAFHSLASTLVAGDTNGVNDVFVRDRTLGTTQRVSVGSGGVQGNDHSRNAFISGDGRYVAHASSASNLVSGDSNVLPDIFVYDRQTGTTERVSIDSGGFQGNGDSRAPSLSTDGQVVAFHAFATNLVSGDGNGAGDVFVRNRGTGVTERMSVSSSGGEGNGHSYRAALSGTAGAVAFMSEASTLVPGDTNGVVDVFVRTR
jgi:Tol biopolymer transport system component